MGLCSLGGGLVTTRRSAATLSRGGSPPCIVMTVLYSIEVALLLDTNLDSEEVKHQVEYAISAACTQLEQNGISPTYKMRHLKKIG